MLRNYKETISYYADLRQTVYEFVQDEYSHLNISASGISYHDAIRADQWAGEWDNPSRIATWEWTKMYSDYQGHSGIKRFDLALKQGNRLLALCYGVPSKRKFILKLHAIERTPINNPLNGRILEIVLFAADSYAGLLGSKELWLCNPMSPAHVRMYSKAGFEPNSNSLGIVTHLISRYD